MNTILKISKTLTILLLVLGFQSCGDDDNNNPNPPNPSEELNIVQTAQQNAELSSLVAAIEAADLAGTLSGDGPFTVLAPTNAAFEAFLEANNYASLNDVPADVLSQVLLNHVIDQELTSSSLVTLGSGYTNTQAKGAGDNNLSLYFDTSSDVRFNNVASVATPDVMASNGVVHVIDAVIGLPNLVDHAIINPNLSELVSSLTADGNTAFTELLSADNQEYTVFAPNNAAFSAFENPNGNDINKVLANHVIVGATAISTNLSNTYLNTAATFGDSEDSFLSIYVNTDNGVSLNGVSAVTAADVVATNGVIHITDAVIDLPTVVTFATADPNFSSLVAALTTEGQPNFVDILTTSDGQGDAPFTVFAPLNSAFEALLNSNAEWNDLTDIEAGLLTSVLQHHVVAGGNVRSGDLVDGIAPSTLEGDMITINLPGNDDNPAKITDGAGNTDIDIIAVDVQAVNGVIHVIESVLLPDTN